MKKKILSVLTALAITVSLSACQSPSSTELIDSVISETTQVDVITQISEVNEGYDPYDYPVHQLPDGWTFEKICGLVEIGGEAIKFPCTVEEFESISDNIRVLEQDSIHNYCDIYYDDINIGTLEVDKNSQLIKLVVLTFVDEEFENVCDKITFAGYTYNQIDEIISFMDKNFELSDEYYANDAVNSSFKRWRYNHDANTLDLQTHFSNSKLDSIFIKLEEDINE